jgi:hypothetical protein
MAAACSVFESIPPIPLLLRCVVQCRNVIGIEIENTVGAVVQYNTASNNTAGIVVQL